MSEIPFYFPAPTPLYFRKEGHFNNPKNKAFVDWCFERCSPSQRVIHHDSQKIILKPYHFIFGRLECSEETGLTENEVRTQQKRWENYGFLKKATNKTPNRFTIYEWVLTYFSKYNHQQNHQETTKKPPTNHHNQEEEKKRSIDDHQPYPSSNLESELTDDFSIKNEISTEEIESESAQHNIKYRSENEPPQLIEVVRGVLISQDDLAKCIAIKGSEESVKYAIEYIMRSPGRKRKIADWPNALSKWEIKDDIKPRIKENEEMAKRLAKLHENNKSWSCRVQVDRNKHQKGILFYLDSSVGNPESYFIPYTDPEFKEKVTKLLRDKKMQQGRISNS